MLSTFEDYGDAHFLTGVILYQIFLLTLKQAFLRKSNSNKTQYETKFTNHWDNGIMDEEEKPTSAYKILSTISVANWWSINILNILAKFQIELVIPHSVAAP